MSGAALAEEVTIVTMDTVPGKTCTLAFRLPAVVHRDVDAVSFKDPTFQASIEAIEMLEKLAARYNANTVLGFSIGFTPRTERDTGKVIATGTFANCQ